VRAVEAGAVLLSMSTSVSVGAVEAQAEGVGAAEAVRTAV